MKISEVIKELQLIKDSSGDLEVRCTINSDTTNDDGKITVSRIRHYKKEGWVLIGEFL